MSIHKSLQPLNNMARHRNVLSRKERLDILEEENRWDVENDSVLGLAKVRNIKIVKKKAKKEEAEGVEGEEAVAVEGAEPEGEKKEEEKKEDKKK